MQKIKVPKRCRIGAMWYDIVWSDAVLKETDTCGRISSYDQMIQLGHRKNDQSTVNLLHGFFHGALGEFGIDVSEEDHEDHVNSLAHATAIFLESLGIELDFSDIPDEEIKNVK